jgi:DNA integrity scanning protein DisA with diadenylate cyclase activity
MKPPSFQVAVTGGLKIGSTSATVSLAVGANPSQELISASLDGLSSNDLIAFASDILRQDIPRVDEDVFNLEAVSFSISTGVQVGTIYTPPGASFAGTIDLFGEKATMEAFLREEIKISGTFEAFALGPLAVTGAQGPNPKFEFELGPKKQSLLLDGAAKLLELEASLHVEATLLPKPAFEFDMLLAFTELLPFTLHGAMLGALDIKHVSKLDFELSAKLEQKILDYLMTQANLQIVTAAKGAKEGFDNARAKLDQVEASFKKAVDAAQAQLSTAQIAWEAKQKSVKDAFDQVKQSTQVQQAGLQSRLDTAQAAFNQKIDSATKSLEQTKVNAAIKIQSAQATVQTATIDGSASVAAHQADYDNQKKSVDAKFGDALKSVKNAQDKVQAAQREEPLHLCD